VLEARPVIGGDTATEELNLPGFLHDSCSTAHNLIQASPTFRNNELQLDRYGLEYLQPDPVVHPLRHNCRPHVHNPGGRDLTARIRSGGRRSGRFRLDMTSTGAGWRSMTLHFWSSARLWPIRAAPQKDITLSRSLVSSPTT